MKIVMLGSGAAGSVFAAYLRRGGADVWLVDKYKAHMDKIRDEGLRFCTPDGEEVLTGFKTCSKLSEVCENVDMIIIMVKATQTDELLAESKNCISDDTVLVSLQNGLGNEDTMAKYVSRDRILYGSGLIGTELKCPGVCVSKPEEGIQMRFGALEKSPMSERAGKALEELFNKGGCNASFDEDVRPYVWKKVIANCGYNATSAVLRLKVGEVFADENGREIVLNIWKEGAEVAKAAGVGDLWPLLEAEEENIEKSFGTYYPSMAQDAVLHKRPTEIEFLNGAISRYGKKLGVKTPFNDVLTLLISCIEDNYDKQYFA